MATYILQEFHPGADAYSEGNQGGHGHQVDDPQSGLKRSRR